MTYLYNNVNEMCSRNYFDLTSSKLLAIRIHRIKPKWLKGYHQLKLQDDIVRVKSLMYYYQ